ncbi:sigma-E factor negative regulatory protein [Kaarinaea lacus]
MKNQIDDQLDDHVDEKISSLVDGELEESQHQQTVNSMLADEEKCCCWERYHLISDAMKGKLPRLVDCQLSSRVMAELENEPTVLAPQTHKTSFGKRMAGLAVAASVATIAVLGVQFMYQEDGTIPSQQIAKVPTPEVRVAQKPIQQAPARQDIQIVTQTIQQSPLMDQQNRQILPRIHKYLLDHNRSALNSNPQITSPFIRNTQKQDKSEVAQQDQVQSQGQIQK